VIEAKNCFDSPFNEPSHDLNPKTEVAAREHKERKAKQMNNENEDHKNGGWGNLQIPFSLCPSRSFAAIQFRSSGLITPQFWGNDCPVFGYVRARILLADSWPYRFKSIAMRMKKKSWAITQIPDIKNYEKNNLVDVGRRVHQCSSCASYHSQL
jgi:hypothetical protein